MEEKEQPHMEPMDVSPAVEIAEMFSLIEELTNNLGLRIDLSHLFQLNQWLFHVSARHPKSRQTEFRESS